MNQYRIHKISICESSVSNIGSYRLKYASVFKLNKVLHSATFRPNKRNRDKTDLQLTHLVELGHIFILRQKSKSLVRNPKCESNSLLIGCERLRSLGVCILRCGTKRESDSHLIGFLSSNFKFRPFDISTVIFCGFLQNFPSSSGQSSLSTRMFFAFGHFFIEGLKYQTCNEFW